MKLRVRGLAFCAALFAAQAQTPQIETGKLPASWITGGPNCLEVPDWQIHEYNPTFYILRESGCTHYEKPFLYLIFGNTRALLLDTGAGNVDTPAAVMRVMRSKGANLPLLVVHSHGHGDHTAGDAKLAALPDVLVVAATPAAVQKAFGIPNWPEQIGSVDLGGRIIDTIPIPGHHPVHVAYYDRKTGILLTGDHLYPGRLYVQDFALYRASTRRLVEFTASHPVAHILGCHIEQSATPFVDYPVNTKYQPEEHALALTRGHLLELLAGLDAMESKPTRAHLRDFTIWPREPRPPAAK